MPRIDLVVQSPPQVSARSIQVASMFDLDASAPPSERWSFDFDPPDDWSIGAIIGPSGSGKSTVAREIYGDDFVEGFEWDERKTVLDGFPKSCGIKDVTGALSSVGFSSPPSWLKPYGVLSTGQKFRANVARAIVSSGDVVAFDEFTSVVDRVVAQVGSAAVAKAVRRAGKRFVAVSCHSDIVDWLQPDWVLTMPSGTLERRTVQQRPPIELEIRRVGVEAWNTFRPHHYLSHTINKSAACYVAEWRRMPVAFSAWAYFPHPVVHGWRAHRTVCLPDFQGVGIGNAVNEAIAAAYRVTGRPVMSVTSHPAMIGYRARSPVWRMVSRPKIGGSFVRAKKSKLNEGMTRSASVSRNAAGFRYVGEPDPTAAIALGIVT